jgi:mannose-1-phosphate guanylyltransferase
MKAVIFAGGVGTRLWPLSRKKSPKQFEKIVGDKSTLQLAVERIHEDFSWDDIYIATGKQYISCVLQQLTQLPPNHVIGEPQTRDVGPAVGLMVGILNRISPTEPMVIIWSDHLVKNVTLFRKTISAAGSYIKKNPKRIIFIAQKPRFASDNLGWIEYGKLYDSMKGICFYSFVDFQYKPDKETAMRYYQSGHHAWNVGYFVTTASFLWQQYQLLTPNIYQGLSRIADAFQTARFHEELDSIYPTLEKIHFDNAILEKLRPTDAFVISEDIGWSDIGAWEALKEALEEANDKNVTQGKVLLTDTRDSLIYNYTDQLIATIDLEDLLVVNTNDVVLVCKKSSVSKIKRLVESLAGTEHEHLT